MAVANSGRTQPSAVLVTELAMPTTVSTWLPILIVAPSWLGALALADSTTWLSLVAQWPACRVRSSTGPPGDDRATRFSGVEIVPSIWGIVTCAVTLADANGPATAVTPVTFVAAVSCAAVTADVSTVTATSAPRCAANAWSNGLCASASMPRASVEAAGGDEYPPHDDD